MSGYRKIAVAIDLSTESEVIVKRAVQVMMEDLASSANIVTRRHELLHDRLAVRQRPSPIALVAVNTIGSVSMVHRTAQSIRKCSKNA